MSDAVFVPVCPEEDRTFPYPYDCSKYYQCASGEPILIDCPWAASCTPIPYPE